MIKKIRRNKVAVTIISVILGMIIVFSVNFGIVNFILVCTSSLFRPPANLAAPTESLKLCGFTAI